MGFDRKIQLRKTYRVVLQIISVEKFKLLFWTQVIEAIAEKINFLLYKPASEILPLRYHWKLTFIQLHLNYTHVLISFIYLTTNILFKDLRLGVGKSEDEVGDVVLSSFFIFT